MPEQNPRRPGRPREESAERTVLDATVALLLEHDDPAKVTITAVTERAGVARATLYRRWGSREELIAAALDTVREVPSIPDTGDLEADLEAFYEPQGMRHDPEAHRLIKARLIQTLNNPELRRVYWERYVRVRREPLFVRLRAEVSRGGLPRDTDVEAFVELLSGVGYYQYLVRPDDGRQLERMRRAVRLLVSATAGEAPAKVPGSNPAAVPG